MITKLLLKLTGGGAALLIAASAHSAESDRDVAQCDSQAWRLVFVNGPGGEALSGERSHLLDAIRRGSPVRVAWGEADADGAWSVEEFADAGFTNIIGGSEVVAQIAPALIQTSYTDAATASLRNPIVEWHAIIATDGRLDAVMVSRESGQTLRAIAQRTRVHWYAQAPGPACDTRLLPDIAPPGRRNVVERNDAPG